MSEARDKVIAALVALLVQIILVVAAVCYGPEPSTVESVAVVPSAQGVPEL